MSKRVEGSPSQLETMSTQIHYYLLRILIVFFAATSIFHAPADDPIPKLNYEAVPDFFQLPDDQHFVEVAGVPVNSERHMYVFHRGKHPLMEFDANGKFLRSIADDLFVTAHAVRVDAETTFGPRTLAHTWF